MTVPAGRPGCHRVLAIDRKLLDEASRACAQRDPAMVINRALRALLQFHNDLENARFKNEHSPTVNTRSIRRPRPVVSNVKRLPSRRIKG